MEAPICFSPEGLLVINKPSGVTSFDIVARVRHILKVKRVGHAGTLDPFATGILLVLVGRNFTRRSDEFMVGEKKYRAGLMLGQTTDTHDIAGKVTSCSDFRPAMESVEKALGSFMGRVWQIPPMFSAKSINGVRLYELARKGRSIHREPVKVQIHIDRFDYQYPRLLLDVTSGKGAYIRAIARDLGILLGCGAHLESLERSKSGNFSLNESFEGKQLFEKKNGDLTKPLLKALKTDI